MFINGAFLIAVISKGAAIAAYCPSWSRLRPMIIAEIVLYLSLMALCVWDDPKQFGLRKK